MTQPDLFAQPPDAAEPSQGTPPPRWADLPFFAEDWPRISRTLAADGRLILPEPSRRFAALALTPPEAVRVVILGQDPYPTPGHAMGLAFSVNPDVRPLARSLANIFRELRDDVGQRPRTATCRAGRARGCCSSTPP
jgi:uracil-DNA glycosylase